MLAWVGKFERSAPQDLPSRNIRPWLSNGLIIDFLLYGVVYMSSMLGLIDAHYRTQRLLRSDFWFQDCLLCSLCLHSELMNITRL